MHCHFQVLPLVQRYLYRPIVRAVQWLADRARPIQSCDVNQHLLYVFVVVVVACLTCAY
ncbi:MAG: hypothetical protein ABSH51_26960 [Solirubrobacteraceae bacterium]